MDEQEQLFFSSEPETDDKKVVCLGLTFNNEDERREYFKNELRKKLSQLKKIEGFPIAEDEDIIALSDPPFYTACPNPWINDLNQNTSSKFKKVKPYFNDVSIGKSGAIYNAHSYHTKVPHKAIMKYILHYTNPGDVVLDVFSGTGMTGVAGHMCGNRKEIESLGYTVQAGNQITDGENVYELGSRKVILNDLSPTAALISSNYNRTIDINDFKIEASYLLKELSSNFDDLFSTTDTINGIQVKAQINYAVWSDDFECPHCNSIFNFFDVAVNFEEKKVMDTFSCPTCRVELNKRKLNRVFKDQFDEVLNKIIRKTSQKLVLINYSYNGKNYNKIPDQHDIDLVNNLNLKSFNLNIPTNRMIEGDESRRNDKLGLTHTHHYFTNRNLITIAFILEKTKNSKFRSTFLGILRSSLSYSTKMVKVNISRLLESGGLFSFGAVTGTLYAPSVNGERPVTNAFKSKLKSIINTIPMENCNFITNQSALDLSNIESDSIDYIFIDPPFGANLMYSELNYIWETFMNLYTDTSTEAIINGVQNKFLPEYEGLMTGSLKELFRVLKPERWITIEFSNSKSSIWNSIQNSLQKSGFIVANVSALDKKQGSFKSVTSTTAVKQDLVISAYKPSNESVTNIIKNSNTVESAWIFTNQYLGNLPVHYDSSSNIVSERTPRILFDRMVAYHVQSGLAIPISSAEFQVGISQRFPMRDGMAFLESQVAEYDKQRTKINEFSQMTLFVSDENSAIEWLRQKLLKKVQTRQDLHPHFMKEIQHIAKHEYLPELDDLLSQNFLRFDDEEASVPSQILTYLRRNYPDLRGLDASHPAVIKKALHRWYVPDPNKQADLEKLREKALLREFNLYVEEMATSKKKLKVFRTEAIRAGFKKAWSEKEFQTIITVGDRLPETIIQEDDKLLMYYDNAQIKLDM